MNTSKKIRLSVSTKKSAAKNGPILRDVNGQINRRTGFSIAPTKQGQKNENRRGFSVNAPLTANKQNKIGVSSRTIVKNSMPAPLPVKTPATNVRKEVNTSSIDQIEKTR